MRPSKPKATRIAEAHLASSERGARLLAATGGDAEHAARIDRTLEDLRANSRPPAPVIRLPARPYDREQELEELELAPRSFLDSPVSLVVWAGVGVGIWVVLAAIAFVLYLLVDALA
jgi:hypothetical protein